MIRNLGLQGKHKLADRWASNLYVVDSQIPNLPVFRLRPEDGNRPVKFLHPNHILPLEQSVRLDLVPDADPTPGGRVLRKRQQRCHKLHEHASGKDTVSTETPEEIENKGGEYTDSKEEENGMWYDLSVRTPSTGQNEKMSKPFSLDLDVVGN